MKRVVCVVVAMFCLCFAAGCENKDQKAVEFKDVSNTVDLKEAGNNESFKNESQGKIKDGKKIVVSECQVITDEQLLSSFKISKEVASDIVNQAYYRYIDPCNKDINFICNNTVKYESDSFYVFKSFEYKDKKLTTLSTYYVDTVNGDVYELILTDDILKPLYIH